MRVHFSGKQSNNVVMVHLVRTLVDFFALKLLVVCFLMLCFTLSPYGFASLFELSFSSVQSNQCDSSHVRAYNPSAVF